MKIAEAWQPRSSEPFEGRALPLARTVQAPVEPVDIDTHEASEEIELDESVTLPVSRPKARLSFTARLVRRVKRLLRMRAGAVPRCNGFTRTGLACRAPSMLNGYCRMHGGS